MGLFKLTKDKINRMKEKRDIEGLRNALLNNDETIRLLATIALGQLGDSAAIPALREYVAHSRPVYISDEHLVWIAFLLAAFGDEKAWEPLLTIIRNYRLSHEIREQAVQFLIKLFGEEALRSLAAARAYCKDNYWGDTFIYVIDKYLEVR